MVKVRSLVLGFVVSLVVVLSIVPFALAADDDGLRDAAGQGEAAVCYTGTIGNPLYGLSSEGQSATQVEPREVDELALLATPTLSRAAAADYITDGLAAHDDYIAFYVKNGTWDDAVELYAKAFEEDGNPIHGDYLRWNWTEVSWWVTDYGTNSLIEYEVSYYMTPAQSRETLAEAERVIEFLDLDGLDDYERALAIYDYLCINNCYDYAGESDLKYTPYAALVNGTSVCQGYSVAFYMLANMADLSARVIYGVVDGVEHSWNIVQMSNGYYYNVDATWGSEDYHAGADQHYYFLKSDIDFYDHPRAATSGVFGYDYACDSFYAAYPMDSFAYDPSCDRTYVNPEVSYALFPDVQAEAFKRGNANMWYVSGGWLDYVVRHGLIGGTNAGNFEPNAKITRAQVAVILYRAECNVNPWLESEYGSTKDSAFYSQNVCFDDMKAGVYYTAALCWAKDCGIFLGDSSTNFATVRPNDPITRQEFCAVLARYVNGGFVPEMTFEDLGPTNIIDLHKVSGWAENSVAWAIDNGIMGGSSNGDGTNSLKPRNNTTRAEASKMFTSAIRDVMDR